jgi:hypothetical protein
MPRDYEVYLEDIRDAIGKVKRYTTGLYHPTRAARVGTPAREKLLKKTIRLSMLSSAIWK